MSWLDWVALVVIVGGLVYLRRQLAAAGHAVAAWVRARPPLGLLLWAVPLAALAVLAAWLLPVWQLASRAASLTPEKYLELENAYRATIVQALAGVALLVTIYLTWRRVAATEQQVEVAREEQITERFTRAIEQLGSDKLEVRLGGIYALERIARDSQRDHWPIMEVLTAYLRHHAARSVDEEELPPAHTVAIGVQAVLTVIGRRRVELDPPYRSLDLNSTRLCGADLSEMEFSRVDLSRADLREANLGLADLRDAKLSFAELSSADLSGAKLVAASLRGANLSEADLSWADLSVATLIDAQMSESFLERTNLSGTRLHGANLSRAKLPQADLSSARLPKANLAGADLSEAELFGADLSQAYLAGVKLSTSDLRGVDLSRAKGLTREQIESARTDENTILPDYLKEQQAEPAGEGGEEEG